MPIYSHSQLSVYEQCPLKYRLCYRDRIKRETEGIEAFLGTVVHDTLKKCYDDARYARVNSPDALLSYYEAAWQKNWRDSIVITRRGLTQENYRALGRKMIESYYKRYAQFDSDITIATEMNINFALDNDAKYRMTGYIDRLARTGEDAYQIHDYKTSSVLPGQKEADNDRQLALYHIGVQQKWPEIRNINLVWHYLAFDTKLVSSRTPEAISRLVEETRKVIDEIAVAGDFPPRESGLCEWCEYPDLCPMRKHFYMVEGLPVNEYLNEAGVVLVNKYAELREEASRIDREMVMVREALIEYARNEGVQVIKGSDRKARVKLDEKLKFPGKNEDERQELDSMIKETGRWMEVSQLDTAALVRVIEEGRWDRETIDMIMRYGQMEEVSSIYLSRLKEEEK